ncbi:MAG: hypothetical protein ACREO3_04710 [Arenimonas sp.]
MYEKRHQALAHPRVFYRRVAMHALVALAVLAGSLAMGMTGYASLEDLPWMDAFLDSAMLLGGMGPVHTPVTEAGKLFAGLYALYSGLVFIAVAALVVTPIGHRVLHRFHWNEKDE